MVIFSNMLFLYFYAGPEMVFITIKNIGRHTDETVLKHQFGDSLRNIKKKNINSG